VSPESVFTSLLKKLFSFPENISFAPRKRSFLSPALNGAGDEKFFSGDEYIQAPYLSSFGSNNSIYKRLNSDKFVSLLLTDITWEILFFKSIMKNGPFFQL